MPSYLALAAYRSKTTIDGSLVDLCVNKGKDVDWWLEAASAEINMRLVKRYNVDFGAPGPVPDAIIKWLVRLVNVDVLECTGAIPEGRVDDWANEARKQVYAECEKAADAENGIFELPLRNTDALGNSAINKGGPFVKTFLTPHTFWKVLSARRP